VGRKHFRDCAGPSVKTDFQTRPLVALDEPAPVAAGAAACHSYRRRAPHTLAPSRVYFRLNLSGSGLRCRHGPTRALAGSVTIRRPGSTVNRKSSCCLTCNMSVRRRWTFPEFPPAFLLNHICLQIRIPRFSTVIVDQKPIQTIAYRS